MGTLLLAGLAVAALGLFVWSAVDNAKLRKMPVTRIAACRHGDYVKIVGRVVPLQTLTAPGSGRACVAYFVQASFGKRHVTSMASTVFAVTDGDKQAIVECGKDQAIVMDLDRDHEQRGWIRHIKASDAPGLRALGLDKAETIDEGIVEPGETVAVFGDVRVANGEVRIVKPRSARFLVTDKRAFHGS